MRAVVTCFVLLSGCTGIQEGYKKGFNKGFLEKCVKAAKEKGASETRANEYCQCALKKTESGATIDEAAAACQ